MKTPMYIHGVIVSTSFVPYYIAEAMGMPFPLVGLKELDPTTPDPSPMTQFTYLFVALFMAMYSYTEIKGTMEGKVFAVLRVPLRALVHHRDVAVLPDDDPPRPPLLLTPARLHTLVDVHRPQGAREGALTSELPLG